MQKNVRDYCKELSRDIVDNIYVKQVVRSSSSIGANYIEANDKLGKNDFLMKLRIARREAKETEYWLELLEHGNQEVNKRLKTEVIELRKILSAIIIKIDK